nr:MAG TPA: hypothetical protein [Caudoviricetes sp.]
MRRLIRNALQVECTGIDFTKVTKIEFYLKQGELFFQYSPTVTDATHLLVDIPKADASQLTRKADVKLQFAFTDANGVPDASDIVSVLVDDLLKEAGYGD